MLLDNYFEIYQWKSDNAKKNVGIEDRHNFVLQPGDLLYRSNGQNGASAHVEFYLGGEHSFGWGDIQSSYNNENNSKYFKIIRDLDIYNIGKTRTANQVSNGETYRVENSSGGGIYNTIRRFTDYNCRYDYVIRLKKKVNVAEEVENE